MTYLLSILMFAVNIGMQTNERVEFIISDCKPHLDSWVSCSTYLNELYHCALIDKTQSKSSWAFLKIL